MSTLLISLLSIMGYSIVVRLFYPYIMDIYKVKAFLDLLKIKYDYFDSSVKEGCKGIYIQDPRFNGLILYFDNKGKLL